MTNATAAASHPADDLRIARGSIRDYDALARFHYRAGRPATSVLVLVLRAAPGTALARHLDTPAGVLVVSMPTLNGLWRARALPELPRGRPADAAAWINAHLRTISRVVIDPRFRGLGLARGLVAAYLRDPLTDHTEALAAMGAFCPFFEAAGMTPHPCPVSPADARLVRACARAGVLPIDLPRRLSRRGDPSLEHALRRWAASSRRTHRRADDPPIELARLAARCLDTRPVAYVHRAGQPVRGPSPPAMPSC